MTKQLIAIDFDWTLWNTGENKPMDGAREALGRIREAGHRVLIHSCNNPKWIRQMCLDHDLTVDYVWGEEGLEAGKPVCAIYVDDRAHHFKGDWVGEIDEILARVDGRGVKDFKGPNYVPDAYREAQIRED